MNVADKLSKAKIQLILSQPFFASLILSIPIQEDASIKTSITDGQQIRCNPEYINGLSLDEVKGMLCHEILHAANFHTTRREGRDLEQWNKATDYAINPLIIEAGLKLPPGALLSDEYTGMSAEKIFSMLPAPPPDNKQGEGEQDPGNCGGVEDSPAKTDGEKQEQESQMKQKVIQAAMNAKRAGNMPEFLKRLVDEILEPKINWKEVLARFISDTARNDYSFSMPNPRFIHSGFFLPSLKNEEPGKICFLVDVSGSMDEELFNEIGAELKDAASTLGSTLTAIYVNTEVTGTQDIEPDEDIPLHANGSGGTDFAPGFDYIEEEGLQPKAAIYLTDGECNSYPDQTPDYPVLWVVYDNKTFAPPFGEVLHV